MKLLAIKTVGNFYLSDNVENKSYHNSIISSLFFDGEKATVTYNSNWYRLPVEPSKVEKKANDKYINKRWELKTGYPVSELTPAIMHVAPDEDVNGLYSPKYDVEPGEMEVVDVEWVVISVEDNFRIEKQAFNVENSILDKIQFNPILLPTKPCMLTSEEFYKIVRRHVQTNIDPKYAQISSDYDFCLTVKKVLRLHDPEPYRVSIGTKRKPKTEIRYNQVKTIEVFECAPKIYNNYTVLKPITGDNYEDLEKKVQEYLTDLMIKINAPVVECKCCGGTGVVIEEKEKKAK